MKQELEKLIDLAIADGVLTEKKKQVLLKKVQELNEDMDEFEMVLEAKLHLKEQELNKNSVVLPAPPLEKKNSKQEAIDNLGKMDIGYSQQNLIHYIYKKDVAVVKLLLEAGLNPNTKWTTKEDKKDVSYLALNSAIEKENLEIIKLLISFGADVNYFDDTFYKPINKAIEGNNTELLNLLIEKGADINKGNNKDENIPIIQAIKLKNATIVEILAPKADLNIICSPSWSKVTPLIYALDLGQINIAKMIIENGADVNKPANSNLETPLILAIKNKNIEAVKLLIEKGADVNKARKDGNSPMFIAHQRKLDDILKLLITAGASPLTENELINSATLKSKIFNNLNSILGNTNNNFLLKNLFWAIIGVIIVLTFIIAKGPIVTKLIAIPFIFLIAFIICRKIAAYFNANVWKTFQTITVILLLTGLIFGYEKSEPSHSYSSSSSSSSSASSGFHTCTWCGKSYSGSGYNHLGGTGAESYCAASTNGWEKKDQRCSMKCCEDAWRASH